ncbi:hypothetical protein FACS1894216_16360 [Synergistales bacterium]|nr:hypothetical protein FACS1894216_16360 [Synergistales bacterium]
MSIFDHHRSCIGNGEKMSDLQVVLETALHSITTLSGLLFCDPGLPENCPRYSCVWRLDESPTIELLRAAIDEFCPHQPEPKFDRPGEAGRQFMRIT